MVDCVPDSVGICINHGTESGNVALMKNIHVCVYWEYISTEESTNDEMGI